MCVPIFFSLLLLCHCRHIWTSRSNGIPVFVPFPASLSADPANHFNCCAATPQNLDTILSFAQAIHSVCRCISIYSQIQQDMNSVAKADAPKMLLSDCMHNLRTHRMFPSRIRTKNLHTHRHSLLPGRLGMSMNAFALWTTRRRNTRWPANRVSTKDLVRAVLQDQRRPLGHSTQLQNALIFRCVCVCKIVVDAGCYAARATSTSNI